MKRAIFFDKSKIALKIIFKKMLPVSARQISNFKKCFLGQANWTDMPKNWESCFMTSALKHHLSRKKLGPQYKLIGAVRPKSSCSDSALYFSSETLGHVDEISWVIGKCVCPVWCKLTISKMLQKYYCHKMAAPAKKNKFYYSCLQNVLYSF